jgi:hypothetical protein
MVFRRRGALKGGLLRSLVFGSRWAACVATGLLAIGLQVPLPAQAQTWTRIEESISLPWTTDVDEAAFVAGDAAGTVRYRVRTSRKATAEGPASELRWRQVVDCERLTTQTEAVHAMRDGREVLSGETEVLAKAVSVVDLRSAAGKAALMACRRVVPGALERWMTFPSQEACAGLPELSVFTLCKSETARVSIGVLEQRMKAVGNACGAVDLFAHRIRKNRESLLACQGTDVCVRAVIGKLSLAVDEDYRAVVGKRSDGSAWPLTCVAPSALMKLAEEERVAERARQEFSAAESGLLACSRKALAKLDDRVSDARTIAKAAMESCKSELNNWLSALVSARPEADPLAAKTSLQDLMVVELLNRRTKQRR